MLSDTILKHFSSLLVKKNVKQNFLSNSLSKEHFHIQSSLFLNANPKIGKNNDQRNNKGKTELPTLPLIQFSRCCIKNILHSIYTWFYKKLCCIKHINTLCTLLTGFWQAHFIQTDPLVHKGLFHRYNFLDKTIHSLTSNAKCFFIPFYSFTSKGNATLQQSPISPRKSSSLNVTLV